MSKYLDSDKASGASQQALALAEKHLTRSVEINPQFHTSMYNLGLVNVEKKDGLKAEDYLLKALELHPNHRLSHEYLQLFMQAF